MNFEIVDIPNGAGRNSNANARFAALRDSLLLLEDGKCVKAEGFTQTDGITLRAFANYHGLSLHIRITPDAAYIWIKEKGVPRAASIAKRRGQGVTA